MERILYIEDNMLNMRLIEKSLRTMNYDMLQALDGKTGLDLAETERPDLILLDLHLPDMSGIEVARTLREQPIFKDTPIIAITANVTKQLREQCISGDFDAYLTKPVRRARLLRVIQQMIETGLADTQKVPA